MASTIIQPTAIEIGTTLVLSRQLGNSSTQRTSLLDRKVSVSFDSYSEGVIVLAPGIVNHPLLSGSELIILESDNFIDVTVKVGEVSQTIANTKRFSIESGTGVDVSVSNNSDTATARISFITTNKPTVIV